MKENLNTVVQKTEKQIGHNIPKREIDNCICQDALEGLLQYKFYERSLFSSCLLYRVEVCLPILGSSPEKNVGIDNR